ncbi:MAG TPA: PilZ domain-containing protein [Candidatus Sulfotelmatobacter sp.]|nr:PilZ domain-containing protein [Candidatus Sulfotelmatobacter sp.]
MAYAQQRQHPRFKAALPVELRQAGTSSPLRAQTADICLGGCYVEMTSTQKVSNEVEIVLWIGQEKVLAKGVVVSNHPAFGNGIKFTQVSEDARIKLQKFVESLDPFRRSARIGR